LNREVGYWKRKGGSERSGIRGRSGGGKKIYNTVAAFTKFTKVMKEGRVVSMRDVASMRNVVLIMMIAVVKRSLITPR
jgi:hypothetical protein